MQILIVGGGGREHALAWKAVRSPRVERVYVAPGNGGTAREPGVVNVAIPAEDLEQLERFARQHAIELTIVGPEAPLTKGITDRFTEAGLRCFGPSKAAAKLEGSKAFAKDFLSRHHIPTARYRTFTDVEQARRYIEQVGAPLVVKADGLAAGKGVVVAPSEQVALDTAATMLSDGKFGPAGHRVVIEECLVGEEVSFICVVSGKDVEPLATSQDHKARDDGDHGPNTGGMGAYSPAPVVDPMLHDRIISQVINPTVQGMAAEGMPYTGFLYAGLIITQDGTPKVLEYNCRFGDPEAQPILLRLNSDLVELCKAALEGRLTSVNVGWDPRPSLGVVMAAGGYPDSYRRGDVIRGLNAADSDVVKVFHAGTSTEGDRVVTSGGRVLCVTALGDTVTDAQSRAYHAVSQIDWPDVYYRRDIGYRAVARERLGR